MSKSSKKRWRWGLVVIVGAALLALWLRHERKPPPQSAAATAPSRPAFPKMFTITRNPEPAEPDAGADAPEIVVDDVSVEKQEVCEGEENLVTVRAHTNNGTDGFLRAVVLGQGSGMQIPVKTYLDRRGRATIPELRLFGRDDAALDVALPRYTVKKCAPETELALTASVLPNSESRYLLVARVVDPPDVAAHGGFRPDRFEWDFGDGTQETTKEPAVEHEFERADVARLYSTHLVKATAVTRARSVSGRTVIERYNRAFDALDRLDVVMVMVAMEPRYAELENGRVHQRFRLWHNHSGPVHLDRIHGKWLREDKDEEIPASQLIGTDVIPAGRPVEFEMSVDLQEHPDFYGFNGDIEGRTDEGLQVRGMFSLMRPPNPPTATNNTPITDPALTARVVRARELLHKDYVTDEDLTLLEQKGKFTDLPARARSAEPPGPAQPQPPQIQVRSQAPLPNR